MGYWSRLIDAVRGKSDALPVDEWWAQYGPTAVSTGGMAVTQLTSLQVATLQACVSIRAEDVAKLPVHVYRRQKNGGKQIVADHPLERLLQQPNDFQSRYEFVEQMQVQQLLRGNAYSVIKRNSRGVPTALIPVNADRVWIYEAPDGALFYQVARRGMHEMAVLEDQPLMIPSEDVLHLRWLALDTSLYGAARIQLAREAIGLALSQQELAGKLSANSTNLGGVLSTDQKLSLEAVERLKKNWRERQQGVRNAGETAVLEQGMKWQALGMTAKDAEMVAARNMQVQEIARLYRMPLHKIGVPEANATSVEEQNQDYMNSVVSSDLGRWEAKLSEVFDLAADNLFVEFDVSVLMRASQQVRYNAYRTGIVGMFITPNEARRAEGLPDAEGGDTLYQPTNVAPIGFAPSASDAGPGSDVTGEPGEGGAGDPAAIDPVDAPEEGKHVRLVWPE